MSLKGLLARIAPAPAPQARTYLTRADARDCMHSLGSYGVRCHGNMLFGEATHLLRLDTSGEPLLERDVTDFPACETHAQAAQANSKILLDVIPFDQVSFARRRQW